MKRHVLAMLNKVAGGIAWSRLARGADGVRDPEVRRVALAIQLACQCTRLHRPARFTGCPRMMATRQDREGLHMYGIDAPWAGMEKRA
jgi:hypothetical protein